MVQLAPAEAHHLAAPRGGGRRGGDGQPQLSRLVGLRHRKPVDFTSTARVLAPAPRRSRRS